MTCAQAFSDFADKRFGEWHGLPPDCDLDELTAHAPLFNEGIGREPVGRRRRWLEFRPVRFDAYAEPVRAWLDGGRLVMLDVDYPDLGVPLDALGEPEARLDGHWDLLALPGGEWVSPSRGLSALINAATSTWLRIAAFPPTTLAAYEDNLRRIED